MAADLVYVHVEAHCSETGPFELEYKAWKHPSDRVWWQLHGVVDAIGVCDGKTTVSDWFKDRMAKWRAAWHCWMLDPSDAYKPSHRSEQASAKHEERAIILDDERHHVLTLSTAGLLVFLHTCACVLKSAKHRSRAKASLEAFLKKCLHLGGNLEEWLSVPAAIAGSCSDSRPGQQCLHLADALGRARASGSPHLQVVALLFHLGAVSTLCDAARQWGARLLLEAKDIINESVMDVAYTNDPTKANTLRGSGSRKRTADEDLKLAISTDVLQRRRSSSGYKLLKAIDSGLCPKSAYAWPDKHALEYQASSWLSASSATTVTVALDAKRLGCPAEETEVAAAWVHHSLGTDFLSWLPPQAGTNSRPRLFQALRVPRSLSCE